VEAEWLEDSATGEAEGVTHTNRATEASVELKPIKELKPLQQDPCIHPAHSSDRLQAPVKETRRPRAMGGIIQSSRRKSLRRVYVCRHLSALTRTYKAG